MPQQGEKLQKTKTVHITSYELNNCTLFFFTIKRYIIIKRFKISFSFSSPLFLLQKRGLSATLFAYPQGGQLIRARCISFRYFPDPLGIVTAAKSLPLGEGAE